MPRKTKLRKQPANRKPGKWFCVIWTLVALTIVAYILSSFLSLFLGEGRLITGNVVVIPIKGAIVTDPGRGFLGENYVSSSLIVKQIKEANENPAVQAIIFKINSPGGSAVASEDIVNAVKKANKTKVALIKDIGASGAYWVASAADKIYASRMSVVGSIGVLSSYLEFSGLMEKYGVTYQRLVGGQYKDLGSPFRNMTHEEYALFKKQIDLLHNFFIIEVAENRKLTAKQKHEISSGMFYTGAQAINLGLIDEIGREEEVKEYIKEQLKLKEVELVEYVEKPSLLDLFSKVISKQSYNLGRGVASFMFEKNQISIKT